MNEPVPHEGGEALDERRGRYADDLARGPSEAAPAEGLDAPEAARLQRAARALEEAVALGPTEIAALLAGEGPAAAPLAPPDLPEDYEVLGEVGRGGMGVVYRARQRSLDRIVAVKVLRPGELLFGQALQRFQQEARVLARLKHPHIVGVHEVGERNGRVYFTMDLIEGRSLSALLKDGPLTPARAVGLLKQVAAAVAYVHAHGLVHRDLKPGNILVDEHDHVTVTDFGLAFEVGSDDGLTLTGQVVGTPGYMSPEQARGDLAAVGEATDVHALGVLLYEMLTGRRPFSDLSPAEQVYAVIHHEPPRPRRVNPAVPEALERVALQALRKRPAERYASARAFLEDLERYEEGLVVRAAVRGKAYRLGRFLRLHPVRVGVGVLAVAAVLFAVFGWLLPLRSAPKDTLLAAARDFDKKGNPEAAALLYQRARDQDPDGHDPELDLRLAMARVDWAQSLWEQNRLDEASAVLERAVDEGEQRYHLYGKEPWGGPVRFALGTVRGLQGRWGEAQVAFGEAYPRHGWRSDEPMVWMETQVFGSRGGAPRPWVLQRFAPAIRDPAHPSRPALRVMLGQVGYFRDGTHGLQVARDPLPDGVTLTDMLGAWLESAALWRERQDSRRYHLLSRTALDGEDDAAFAEALVAVVRDTRRSPAVRGLAAAYLADRIDLPEAVTLGAHDESLADAEPQEVLEQHDRLRALAPAAALQARLERALAVHRERMGTEPATEPWPVRAQREALETWFRDRSGVPQVRTWPEVLAWWQQHGGDDPVKRLAERVGWVGEPTAKDVPNLLSLMAKAGDRGRPAYHHLVSLVVPSEHALGVPRLTARDGGRALAYWQARFLRLEGNHRLRIARLVLTPRGIEVDRRFDRIEPFPNAGVFTFHHETTLPASEEGPRFAVHVPPGRVSAGRTSAETLDVRLQAVAGNAGLVLRIVESTWRSSAGSRVGVSSSNDAVDVEFVLAPSLNPGSYSESQSGRHELVLAVLEPASGDARSWDFDSWRRRLVADVERLASDAEAFERSQPPESTTINRYLYDHQDTTFRLGMLATRIPLPEAIPALRRLFAAHRRGAHGEAQERMLLCAMLLAGFEGMLDDPELGPFLRGEEPYVRSPEDPRRVRGISGAPLRPLFDDYEGHAIGPGGVFWTRVLAHSPSPRIRSLALDWLRREPLTPPGADDLLDLHEAGAAEIPDDLLALARERASPTRTAWGQIRAAKVEFVLVGLLYLGLLWAGTRLLVGALRGPAWRRLSPAAWLIVFGGLVACGTAILRGVDVLPDDLGLACMALGAGILARAARSRSRWAPAALFLIGALLAFGERFVVLPEAIAALRSNAAAIGVALLPWLGLALAGPRPPSPPSPESWAVSRRWLLRGALLTTLLALLVNALTIGGDWGDRALSILLISAGFGALVALVGAFVLIVLGVTARAPVGRVLGWPWPFFAFYVVPVAFGLAVYLVHALGGPTWSFSARGDGWGVLLVVFGAQVLWALFHPLVGARARAAYLRFAASRA